MKTRGFEKVAKYMDVEFPMPERKTQFSACLLYTSPSPRDRG